MRYFFGDFTFHADSLRLEGPSGELPLRRMSARLLRVLLEEAPELLRHETLLDRVWGKQAVTAGVLSQSVREVRSVLGDSSRQPRFIETRHRLGYRFIAPVRIGDLPGSPDTRASNPVAAASRASAPAGTAPALDQSGPELAPGSASRGRMRALALLALTVLIAVLWAPVSERVSGRAPPAGADRAAVGQPHEPEALHWYQRGREALQQGELLQARQWLERSREREPGAAATLVALAEQAGQAGDLIRAREWVGAAEAVARSLPRAEQLRIAARRAALEYRWDAAIAHLTAVSQLNPGDAESALHLFDAQLASGRLAEAAQTLDALDEQPPVSLDRWRLAMARAHLADAQGDHVARLQAADIALEQAGSAIRRHRSHLEQAWARLLLGQRDQAMAQLGALSAGAEAALPEMDALLLEELRAAALREAGDYAAARAGLERIAARAEAAWLFDMAARAQRMAAFVQVQAGEPEAAIEMLQPVIEALRARGNRRELAGAQDVLALAQQRSGDMPGALATGEAALAAHLLAGDRQGEAKARNQLGMLYGRAGRNDEAREQFETALRFFDGAGDRHGLAIAQSNLAILDSRAGRREAARERNERALAAFRELAAWPEVARLEFNLAVQDRGAGRLAGAETRFQRALQAFERIGSADQARHARASLAELALARADPASAARVLSQDPADHRGSPQARSALLTARGRLAALQGNLETAETAYRTALTLRDGAGLPDWARMSALDLATLAANRGRLAQAEQGARQLRLEMSEAGDAYAAIQAGLLLGAMLERQQQSTSAIHVLEQLQAELAQHPDAMQRLQLDLLRAVLRDEGRAELALEVARAARAIGYELLALRADLIVGGDAAERAKATLDRRGVRTEGVPPVLPY